MRHIPQILSNLPGRQKLWSSPWRPKYVLLTDCLPSFWSWPGGVWGGVKTYWSENGIRKAINKIKRLCPDNSFQEQLRYTPLVSRNTHDLPPTSAGPDEHRNYWKWPLCLFLLRYEARFCRTPVGLCTIWWSRRTRTRPLGTRRPWWRWPRTWRILQIARSRSSARRPPGWVTVPTTSWLPVIKVILNGSALWANDLFSLPFVLRSQKFFSVVKEKQPASPANTAFQCYVPAALRAPFVLIWVSQIKIYFKVCSCSVHYVHMRRSKRGKGCCCCMNFSFWLLN